MEKQNFIQQDLALESMRASDFDVYSAYGEVVDNSIQAGASEVFISIEPVQDRERSSKKIGQVVFGDNGHGMDVELLHRCLKLGHSSRYNDRSGIGRFGVGMTLGAIHECRRVEVYSRTDNTQWHWTYIDLDEIKGGNLEYIPAPVPQSPDHDIASKISGSGTIVIWRKYDVQKDSFEKIVEESRFWFGRTFRKFIWGDALDYRHELKIWLNGALVPAWDPLFETKRLTQFPEDPVATVHPDNDIDWEIPTEVNSDKQKSTVKVRMSRLPDELLQTRGLGRNNFAKARHIHRNQNISILRNDREVAFAPFHKQPLCKDEKSRYLGLEISFRAELDQWFDVKNIKRGAKPIRELRVRLEREMRGTVDTDLKYITDYWKRVEREEETNLAEEGANIGVSGTHAVTNRIVNGVRDAIVDQSQQNDETKDEAIAHAIAGEKIEKGEVEILDVIDKLREQGVVVDERRIVGNVFVSMDHGNRIKTLIYNTHSKFYPIYKDLIDSINSKDESLASDCKVLIDLLLVSYLWAESTLDPDESRTSLDTTNEVKDVWSLQLNKLLRAWKG